MEDDPADDKKCAGHVQRLENSLHYLSVSTFFHRSGRCWKKEGFLFGRHVPWSSLAELQFWRLVWVSLADWHSFERLQQLPSLCRNWFVNTCTYFSFKVYYMSHTQIFIGCSGLKINQIISTVALIHNSSLPQCSPCGWKRNIKLLKTFLALIAQLDDLYISEPRWEI